MRSVRVSPERDMLLGALAQRLAKESGDLTFVKQKGRILDYAIESLLREYGLLESPGLMKD